MIVEWALGIGGTILALCIIALLIACVGSLWSSPWASTSIRGSFAENLEFGVKAVLSLVLAVTLLLVLVGGIGWVWSPLLEALHGGPS